MKHQYFGDEKDYVKYSLLRHLAATGLEIMVAWMLTPDDGSNDGRHIGYLDKPEKWRVRDPLVFDFLEGNVSADRRSVDEVTRSEILGESVRFFSEHLSDEHSARQRHMHALLGTSRGADLVFFDPDIGIEVASTKVGRKNSSRYVYWHELDAFYDRGHSLLIYQHFPREQHDPFMERNARQLIEITRCERVLAIKRGHVVFFLVPHRKHEGRLPGVPEGFQQSWEGLITVRTITPES